MAAGAAAAAERGLLRLLQRLGEDCESKDAKDVAESAASASAQKARAQISQLVAELQELSSVWGGQQSSHLQRLGQHLEGLPPGSRARAVQAFEPLQEDMVRQMQASTAALTAWLDDPHEAKLEEELRILEGSYLKSCYRWAGDANTRVQFLMALAMVLRSDKMSPGQSGRISSHFFCLPSQGDVRELWLEGRLARYDRCWRRAGRLCLAANLGDELRRRLGRALEALEALKDLEEEGEREATEATKATEATEGGEGREGREGREGGEGRGREGKDSEKGATWLEREARERMVSRALAGFVAEYGGAPELRELAQCPEFSLRSEALLQVFYDLQDPFEVRNDAVCLTQHWANIKDLLDVSPPPKPAPKKSPKPPKAAKAAKAAKVAKAPVSASPQAPLPSPETLKAKRSRSRSESLRLKVRKTGTKDEARDDVKEAKEDKERVMPVKVDLTTEEKAKPSPPEAHVHAAHAHAYPYYPMWHMTMPGMMPRPLGMIPQYMMPIVEKKKKDKKKDKKARRSSESPEPRKKKEKEGKAKKEKGQRKDKKEKR